MYSRFRQKIISVLSCAVLAAAFIVTLFFSAPKIASVPETAGEFSVITYADGAPVTNTYKIGTDVTAVRISDLTELGKLTKVNYVADKFVAPGHLDADMQTVDLKKPFGFARKGTLIFVIANLDPWAEDFDEQAQSLAKYKIGDYWRFTLQLPEIFTASNIYQRANLVARNGEIENYDFADYNTNYDVKTEEFSPQTEATYIALQFYTRRESLANSFASAQTVTVHYQSAGNSYSGISDCPLIGTEDAVKNINQTSANLLIAFAILAAVVLAVFIVLSLLKHTNGFIPAIVWIFGIAFLLLARFFLTQTTGVPLMWVAFGLASPFVTLGGALLSAGRNFGKIPAKYIFPALAASGMLFAFICPFIPFGAAGAMRTVCAVVKGVCAAALSAFIVCSLFDKKDDRGILQTSCTSVIAVAVFASLFMPQTFPSQINPLFWLCAVTVVMTFVSVFMVFKETEKANESLTANLHKEVERQVKDIKAVISERDNLLTFVSHDMKKPLATAVTLSDTAIAREKDGEQIKTLQIIKQNCARVVSNLTEIAAYAKFNYIAEPSQVTDLTELCDGLYAFYKSDCDANGIVLKNTATNGAKAFVKKQGLESVISNLIINAIEHASCATITLSVKTDKNHVVLSVADDGKGIDSTLDVFKPYVSENNEETSGVGLYICKNIIESMNGELSYETGDGGTAFRIALLKA